MYQSGRKLQGYPNAQKEREEKGGYARIYCWTFRSHITGLTNKQRAVFQADTSVKTETAPQRCDEHPKE
ncbi:hypothetical protein MPH_04859 [Macrophomina phaseolina MS6]|uniref:Uncharacterized protein n=1 Tax=Macrophomina phaseolina (strain MS6) TaxID=1126212 RepID=K2SMC0_MACPH|nr:hypothetical protein MPH_04859 [Macrophomina phaseolina MS6]